jgi:hypothetical protein
VVEKECLLGSLVVDHIVVGAGELDEIAVHHQYYYIIISSFINYTWITTRTGR